jgi:hypothetical protein
LQVKPQVLPSQVAVPFAGAPQGVHDVPHEAVLLLETQPPSLHMWKPEKQVATHRWLTQLTAPLSIPPHIEESQHA